MARLTNKDRINTVMPRLMVYRIGREELSSSIVGMQGGNNNEDTAYLRFDTSQTGNAVWTAFVNWWMKNPNAILLGMMVWNNGSGANQNKGYYWCPTNRVGLKRSDNYTKYMEFTIERRDGGIFDNNADVYEFYFINLTH